MRDLLPGLTLAALFSGRKKWISIAVALVIAASAANFAYFIWSPYGSGDKVKIVDLAKGMTIRKFADELETQGVIKSAFMFQLLARLNGASAKAKAGTYQLSDALSPAEILRKLVAGEVYEKKFALPEGYSIFQAAELLDAKKLFTGEEFLRACRDRQLLQQVGIKAASAEGYLYPGTYN
ncbi:MAG: aminodeoxychorismate lyase, partial [Geobacter sp.]|nr:aminodeoxychorismate lyase [Geobacter sp.]